MSKYFPALSSFGTFEILEIFGKTDWTYRNNRTRK